MGNVSCFFGFRLIGRISSSSRTSGSRIDLKLRIYTWSNETHHVQNSNENQNPKKVQHSKEKNSMGHILYFRHHVFYHFEYAVHIFRFWIIWYTVHRGLSMNCGSKLTTFIFPRNDLIPAHLFLAFFIKDIFDSHSFL